MRKNLSRAGAFLISIAVGLAIVAGFAVHRFVLTEKLVSVPDLMTLSDSEREAWATESGIIIIYEEHYDDNVAAGNIIEQSVLVGDEIKAETEIILKRSKGPDPDVLIEIVSFKDKDIGEIEEFIRDSRLLNATIKFEKSKTVPVSFYISSNPAGGSIKRSDSIVFTVSTGEADALTEIQVPDFSSYTRQQINAWGSTNKIRITITEEFNNDVDQNKLISQSVAPDSTIYQGSSLSLKYSLGSGVVLENLVGKSKTYIDKYVADNGLRVSYTNAYSGDVAKDNAISMDPKANQRVSKGTTLKIEISLGKVSLSSFKGKKLSELESWINEVNKSGAKLRISKTEIHDNSVAKGNIIDHTPGSGDINPGSEIKVSVSRGKGIVVNAFTDTSNKAQEGLKVTLRDEYHSSKAEGIVISQSIAPGTTVDEGSDITLTISKGLVAVNSYIGSPIADFENWMRAVNGEKADIKMSRAADVYSDTIAKGRIVSQNPSSGAVAPGTTITVEVSKGKGILVKNYVGLQKPSGNSGDGLTFNFVYVDNDAPENQVINQSITVGTTVDEGTVITLTLSNGPKPLLILPDLAGFVGTSTSYDQSVSILDSRLRSIGFTNFRFNKVSAEIGAGMVASQTPSGGTSITSDTEIVVDISEN